MFALRCPPISFCPPERLCLPVSLLTHFCSWACKQPPKVPLTWARQASSKPGPYCQNRYHWKGQLHYTPIIPLRVIRHSWRQYTTCWIDFPLISRCLSVLHASTQPLTLKNGIVWQNPNYMDAAAAFLFTAGWTVNSNVVVGIQGQQGISLNFAEQSTGEIVINTRPDLPAFELPLWSVAPTNWQVRTSFFPSELDQFTSFEGVQGAPVPVVPFVLPTGSTVQYTNTTPPLASTYLPGASVFREGIQFDVGDNVPHGSIIHGGNTLPPGFTLPAGTVLNQPFELPSATVLVNDLTVPPGTVVPQGTTLPTGYLLPASVPLPLLIFTSAQFLSTGAVIAAGSLLGAGTTFTAPFAMSSDSILLLASPSAVVTIPPGTVLPQGTIFHEGYRVVGRAALNRNVKVPSKGLYLHVGALVGAGSTLERSSTLGNDTVLAQSITVPEGDTLPRGTQIAAGTILPVGTKVNTVVVSALPSLVPKSTRISGALILPQFPVSPVHHCKERRHECKS